METVLAHNNSKQEFIHITFESNIASINKKGIIQSKYGDLEVNSDDGRGVYAVKPDANITELIDNFFYGCENICLIRFSSDDWYECINEIPNETDIEEDYTSFNFHKGFVVIKHDIPPQDIICISNIN